MLKPVVVATAALAFVGSSIVYAQQRFGGPTGPGDGDRRHEQRHHLSVEDMAAFADARIAALKAGLQLTPDQAKNWPAFEQALRDLSQLRIERKQAREAAAQQQPPAAPSSPFDRMAKQADDMSKAGAALKHIADAGAPLFASLSDAQKHRFHVLARILRPHHHHHMFARNEGGGWQPGGGWQHWRRGEGYGPDNGGGWQGRRFGLDEQGSGAPAQNPTDAETQSQDQSSDL